MMVNFRHVIINFQLRICRIRFVVEHFVYHGEGKVIVDLISENLFMHICVFNQIG